MKNAQKRLGGAIPLVLALFLTGCGGGGSGSTSFAPVAAAPAPVAEAPKPADPQPLAPAVCRVLIYGDSLIADPLLSETMPARMQRLRPAWVIENRAIGGQRWGQGAPRLWGDADLKGAVVVLEWGVNDSKLGTPLTIVPDAITRVKAEGGVPVLTGVVDIVGAHTAMYDTELRRLAIEGGAAWVSWNERQVTTFDGTHPDQPSTDLLVDDLINTVEKESGCAPH